jgi:ABC-type nickel/cobalt efflux system permease component RcnA
MTGTEFFRWLGTPVRAVAAWFPLGNDGRQTLIYLVFALAGPALTAITIWAMQKALSHGWQGLFSNLAYMLGWALMIVVCGLAMFVSVRAVKLGREGFEAGAWRGQRDAEGGD